MASLWYHDPGLITRVIYTDTRADLSSLTTTRAMRLVEASCLTVSLTHSTKAGEPAAHKRWLKGLRPTRRYHLLSIYKYTKYSVIYIFKDILKYTYEKICFKTYFDMFWFC